MYIEIPKLKCKRECSNSPFKKKTYPIKEDCTKNTSAKYLRLRLS